MPPKMVKCSIIEGAPLDISSVDNVLMNSLFPNKNSKNEPLEKGTRNKTKSAKIGVPNSKPGRRSTLPTSDSEVKEAETERYLKRKRVDERDGPIDLNLMKVLGLRGSNGQTAEQHSHCPSNGLHMNIDETKNLQTLCGLLANSAGQITSVNQMNRNVKVSDSRNASVSPPKIPLPNEDVHIKSEINHCTTDCELIKLKKKALKMQIEKDEAKRDYYRLKLEKLRVDILQGGITQ